MSRILVVAGEVSGDMRAAELIEAANAAAPGLRWFGIGGPHMRAAGVETRHDVRDMAAIGFTDVLRRYPFFRRVFRDMLDLAAARKPDLAVLVDYPGFNLRLAARLHAQGIPTLYYICPQVWAWHRSRIPRMARSLDHLISIFPFEAEHFEGSGLPVTFVGHPLVDRIEAARRRPEAPLPWPGLQRVALLPGSREGEINRLLPVMLRAAAELEARLPGAGFLVATPDEGLTARAQAFCRAFGAPRRVAVVEGLTHEILRQADAAMICSGTATVEAALLDCPMTVVYQLNPLSYRLFRSLIRIPHIGMVNVIAGRELCPERIQREATPASLADAMEPLLSATPARAAMLEGLRQVRERMGPGGAAERAAQVLVRMLPAGRD